MNHIGREHKPMPAVIATLISPIMAAAPVATMHQQNFTGSVSSLFEKSGIVLQYQRDDNMNHGNYWRPFDSRAQSKNSP